jgi:hypothetical protein
MAAWRSRRQVRRRSGLSRHVNHVRRCADDEPKWGEMPQLAQGDDDWRVRIKDVSETRSCRIAGGKLILSTDPSIA